MGLNSSSLSIEEYMRKEKSGNDIILTPTEGYDSIFIWLHGLGDSASSFIDFFSNENRPIPKRMKVIMLNAPICPVTINGGMQMPSWFDIKNLNKFHICEEQALNNALKIINTINTEVKNVKDDYSKIFIGGFSQGASLSLLVGFTSKYNLGGIVCCSGFLFPTIVLKDDKKLLPIFAFHGTNDLTIRESLANQSYKRLVDNKFNFVYKQTKQGHEIRQEQFKDIKSFIENNIKI